MNIKNEVKYLLLKRLFLKSTLFDEEWYVKQYPEVLEEHIRPIRHYIEKGWKEGKNPSDKFDANKYLIAYPEIQMAKKNPLKHYLRCGKKEGRLCFPVRQVGALKDKKTNDCPLVSVVIASYNNENFLSETLDSILKQTYSNYEIVVVDDGSTDNSMEIISKYQLVHKNICLYTHPNHEKRGLPATVKLGVDKAKGEFVAFCENGDIWHSQYLKSKIDVVNTYKDVKIVANDVETFGDKKRIDAFRSYIENINSFLSEGENRIDVFYSNGMNYIPTFSAVMIKKDVLSKLNFDTPIPAWIGFWLYRQILKDTCLYYVKEKLTYWRLNNSFDGICMSQKQTKDYDEFILKNNLQNGINFTRNQLRDIKTLNKSKYFDRNYYLQQYGELLNGISPEVHYLFVGWKKGYNPSEIFDNDKYLSDNPDALSWGINPIIYYEKHGKKRKNVIVPVGSTEVFRIQKADIEYIQRAHEKIRTILIISHELSLTGAPRAVLNMAVALKKKGALPVILALRGGGLERELIDSGIKYVKDPILFFRMKYRNDFDIYELFLSMFDTIVFNTLVTIPFVEYFERSKAKKVCWLHEGSFSYRYFEKTIDIPFLLPLFDKVYAVGAYSESFASPYILDKKKLGILLYGMPDIKIPPTENAKDNFVKVLFPGSLEERKGQLVLLDSLRLMSAEIRKQMKVYLVGSILDKKIGKAVKNCCYSCVEYLGLMEHEKLLRLYNNMDLILVPSLDDPMPIVCTEAMILEKAIVVSENTGTASYIENGVNGYKIPANDPKALADILSYIVRNKEELPGLGRRSRAIYDEKFTMPIFENNVGKLILEL